MTTRSERLRQERQAEYQDFLKNKEKTPSSIADIRRDMAREREREIGSQSVARETNGDRLLQGQSSRLSDYNSLKSKRLEEEHQYRGAPFDRAREEGVHRPRRQWNEGPPSRQRVRFEENRRNEVANNGSSLGWEEDEKELLSWARGRGQGGKSRPVPRSRTPPEIESPRRNVNRDVHISVKMRSISAPVVHDQYGGRGGGIPGLGGGAGDSMEAKRNKQKEYAEILRAQMREREEAKERERAKEELLDVDDVEVSRSTQKRERIVEKKQDQKSSLDVKKEYHPKERYGDLSSSLNELFFTDLVFNYFIVIFYSADHHPTTVSMSAIPPIDLPPHILMTNLILTMAPQVVLHTTGDHNTTHITLHDPLQGMFMILTTTPQIHTTTLTITHLIASPLLQILVGRIRTFPLAMK